MKIVMMKKNVPWSLNGDNIPFFWRNFSLKYEWLISNFLMKIIVIQKIYLMKH